MEKALRNMGNRVFGNNNEAKPVSVEIAKTQVVPLNTETTVGNPEIAPVEISDEDAEKIAEGPENQS